MKIIQIFCIIFLLTLQNSCSKDFTIVKQTLEEMFRVTKVTDVQFVIHDRVGYDGTIVDEIYQLVSKTVPTSCILFGDVVPETLPSFRATKATLIFYVYISESPPNSLDTEDIIRIIVYDNNRPKVLLVTILQQRNSSFESILKRMWKEKILDVTVLELLTLTERIVMIIHKYNPFSNVYDVDPYNSKMEWFPDKLTNLHGYPIVVDMFNRTGHIDVVRNSQGHPIKYTGPDATALKLYAKILNFTPVLFPKKIETISAELLLSGEVDILITAVPYTLGNFFTKIDHTTSVSYETWCPVIPVFFETHNFTAQEHFVAIILTVAFILIFWATAFFLKFDSSLWQPLTIFGLMILVSVPREPIKPAQRLVFFTLLLLSCIYSVCFYENLMALKFQQKDQIVYKSFEELDKSGLTPALPNRLFNLTFEYAEGTFLKMKDKSINMSMSVCVNYLVQYKNLTCFMDETMATALSRKTAYRGEPKMHICKDICYWRVPCGYILQNNSLYVEKISEILIRVNDVGLGYRWKRDYFDEFSSTKDAFDEFSSAKEMIEEPETERGATFAAKLAYILLCGYLTSFLVFLSEILINRIKR